MSPTLGPFDKEPRQRWRSVLEALFSRQDEAPCTDRPAKFDPFRDDNSDGNEGDPFEVNSVSDPELAAGVDVSRCAGKATVVY